MTTKIKSGRPASCAARFFTITTNRFIPSQYIDRLPPTKKQIPRMKNPTILTLCILWASLSLSFSTTAQNKAKEEPLGTPARYLFPDDYMADPSVHISKGKSIFIPPTTGNRELPTPKTEITSICATTMYFLPKNRKKGKLPTTALFFLSNRFRGQAGNFWACDVACKDGKYYMYFPAKTKTTSSASV